MADKFTKKQILQKMGLVGTTHTQSYSLSEQIEAAVAAGQDRDVVIGSIIDKLKPYQLTSPEGVTELLNELATISDRKETGTTLEAAAGTQPQEEPPANPFEDLPEASAPVPETTDPRAKWSPGKTPKADFLKRLGTAKLGPIPTPSLDLPVSSTPQVEPESSYLNRPVDVSVQTPEIVYPNSASTGVGSSPISDFVTMATGERGGVDIPPPQVVVNNNVEPGPVQHTTQQFSHFEYPTPGQTGTERKAQAEERRTVERQIQPPSIITTPQVPAGTTASSVYGDLPPSFAPPTYPFDVSGQEPSFSPISVGPYPFDPSEMMAVPQAGGTTGFPALDKIAIQNAEITVQGSPQVLLSNASVQFAQQTAHLPQPSQTTGLPTPFTPDQLPPELRLPWSGGLPAERDGGTRAIVPIEPATHGGLPIIPPDGTRGATGGAGGGWPLPWMTTPRVEGFGSGLEGLLQRIMAALGPAKEESAMARMHSSERQMHKAQATIYGYPADRNRADAELTQAEAEYSLIKSGQMKGDEREAAQRIERAKAKVSSVDQAFNTAPVKYEQAQKSYGAAQDDLEASQNPMNKAMAAFDVIKNSSIGRGVSAIGEGVGKSAEAVKNDQVGGALGGMLGGVGNALMMSGNPFAMAGGAVLKFGEQTLKTIDAVREFAQGMHNANMGFAEFSASMAIVQADKEVRDIELSMKRGDRRAASAGYLAESMSRFDQQVTPITDALAGIANNATGVLLDMLGQILTPVAGLARWFIGEEKPMKDNVEKDVGSLILQQSMDEDAMDEIMNRPNL